MMNTKRLDNLSFYVSLIIIVYTGVLLSSNVGDFPLLFVICC